MNDLIIYFLIFVLLIVSGIALGMFMTDKRSESMKEEALKKGNASYYEFMRDWEGDEDVRE